MTIDKIDFVSEPFMNLTLKPGFFKKYIYPFDELKAAAPAFQNAFTAKFDNLFGKQFSDTIELNQFLSALNEVLNKHSIMPEHIDSLLYFSLNFLPEYLKFRNEELASRTFINRVNLLIELLKLPFRNALATDTPFIVDRLQADNNVFTDVIFSYNSVKHITQQTLRAANPHNQIYIGEDDDDKDIFEFSSDFVISITSSVDKTFDEIKVDTGYNEVMLVPLILELMDYVKFKNKEIYDKVKEFRTDFTQLNSLKNELNSIPYNQNKFITYLIRIILPYLEIECQIKKGRSKQISTAQSFFLFDFFALVGILPYKPNIDDCFIKAKKRLKSQNNPFSIRVKAQNYSYANPKLHLKEVYIDNQPVS